MLCWQHTARGPIVDQKALTKALEERRIGGAGLDVLEKEPPDADVLGLEFGDRRLPG